MRNTSRQLLPLSPFPLGTHETKAKIVIYILIKTGILLYVLLVNLPSASDASSAGTCEEQCPIWQAPYGT